MQSQKVDRSVSNICEQKDKIIKDQDATSRKNLLVDKQELAAELKLKDNVLEEIQQVKSELFNEVLILKSSVANVPLLRKQNAKLEKNRMKCAIENCIIEII